MVLGTASHVGKSLLTTALCRIFARRGLRVAPFKSQNMSLNSAVTPEGLEIGRAQALQAEAAGIPASVHMNPILLKPSGNMSSQVIVHGKIWGQLTAAEYHLRRVHELLPLVRQSFETLAASHDLILLEGAGSPAEINLMQHDIVNLRMAEMADAPCLLVGDIDRGGVFASLLGTLELLEPHQRARITGLVINNFRGDVALLTPGLRMLEARTGKPCLGVIPWLPALGLDEEDSLGLPPIATEPWSSDPSPTRPLRIAVLALPSLSNFTDFDSLRAEPSVDLRLVRTASALAGSDFVILPGSKQTAADLLWLRETGLAAAITTHARTGLLAGICGGMQMLGHTLADPHGIESGGDIPGLALLPLDTSMQPTKRTVLTAATVGAPILFGSHLAGLPAHGYEIHVGHSTLHPGAQPFATLPDGSPEGCTDPSGRIFGTYLHGLFDADPFRHRILAAARTHCGLSSAASWNPWQTQREAALNRWADHVEAHLNLPAITAIIGLTSDS